MTVTCAITELSSPPWNFHSYFSTSSWKRHLLPLPPLHALSKPSISFYLRTCENAIVTFISEKKEFKIVITNTFRKLKKTTHHMVKTRSKNTSSLVKSVLQSSCCKAELHSNNCSIVLYPILWINHTLNGKKK